MKSGLYRRRDGEERLWFSPQDVEDMMERELQRAALYPTLEKPVVDLERFVARHLRVEMDQHAELHPTLLGLTEFFAGAPPKISINRDLTNAIDDDDTPPGLLGRWRATVAHEASHVVMHRILFDVASGQERLFRVEGTTGAQLMRCLKANVLFRGGGSDWREVQANMGMASLLMPQRFFTTFVAEVVREQGLDSSKLVAGSAGAATLVAEVASRCAVSRQAAQIRLEALHAISPRGQGRFSGHS